MRYTLQYPDGREQMLLSVPCFGSSWQFQYRFKQPIAIPAGATLRVDGSFDNSAFNPFKLDPTKAVGFSEKTQANCSLDTKPTPRRIEKESTRSTTCA